jgi:endonuclease G
MIAIMLAAALNAACPQFFAGGQPPIAPSTELICHTGYALGYENAWGEPAWSAELITPASAGAGEATKRNGSFHVEKLLPPAERVSPSVYLHSGYDLGHMTPAGDRGVDKPETFSTANMVPQKPNLNRKIWAGIEASLRDLATGGATLYVVTGPHVVPGATKLQGRVAIPATTWKAVYVVGHGAEAWDCTDTDMPICTQETVAALAVEIGFDPLPAVPASVKAEAYPLPAPTKGVTSHPHSTGP